MRYNYFLTTITVLLYLLESQPLRAQSDSTANLQIPQITIRSKQTQNLGMSKLRAVDGLAIYEGKKSEVVHIDRIAANLSTNNTRQLFARVAGLNIWESDQAGLQLGIGGRGLSPNRTSHFNTRQNGYDMSADALGYPENYYTPPAEALQKIEIVRGAGALQYGTQFGGMVNFVLQQPGGEKPLTWKSRNTIGSFGFLSSYNSIHAVSKNKKTACFAFLQHKNGNGWRPNSNFKANNLFLDIHHHPNELVTLDFEITHMNYLAQQPGGLTDTQFESNPRQSLRERNWFTVNWNMALLGVEYRVNPQLRLSTRTFGLTASRSALGNLAPANVADLGGPRNLIRGTFNNIGNETRLLYQYTTGSFINTILLGSRIYRGFSTAVQGWGSAGNLADFNLPIPQDDTQSDYNFPNFNNALFAEHIFHLTPKISLTPGIRLEHIRTYAEGFYWQRLRDFAGNILSEQQNFEYRNRTRHFLIAGAGVAYRKNKQVECYANLTQNYRAINFTDLRVDNPNFKIDTNLGDERGFTSDAGMRTNIGNWFYSDISAFYLHYNDKIGVLLRADQPPLYNDYRLRTNIGRARNIGLESFAEMNVLHFLSPHDTLNKFSLFVNATLIDARYLAKNNPTIHRNMVEYVSAFTCRTGASWEHRAWKSGFNCSWSSRQFTDATNAIRTASATNGIIPAYLVTDLFIAGKTRHFGFELNLNNLWNARYFTRRAEAYPGPGIIPSEGRSIFLTLSLNI
jgi:Fe(3+) dicitrate transport protein